MKKRDWKPHFALEEEFKDSVPLSGGALKGITVVDICRAVAGTNCTRLLADLGAVLSNVRTSAVTRYGLIVLTFHK